MLKNISLTLGTSILGTYAVAVVGNAVSQARLRKAATPSLTVAAIKARLENEFGAEAVSKVGTFA